MHRIEANNRIERTFGLAVLSLSLGLLVTAGPVRAEDNGPWTYNPDASEKLAPGTTLVVLGSTEQVQQLRIETNGS